MAMPHRCRSVLCATAVLAAFCVGYNLVGGGSVGLGTPLTPSPVFADTGSRPDQRCDKSTGCYSNVNLALDDMCWPYADPGKTCYVYSVTACDGGAKVVYVCQTLGG
jgi:hypothetical protein